MNDHSPWQSLKEERTKVNALEIIRFLLIFLVIFVGVQLSLQSFVVDGVSMEPSFHNNQYLVVDKLTYRIGSLGRGDVVVFENPQNPDNPPLIKRIIGLPGEQVEIKAGHFYIDGNRLDETPALSEVTGYQDYSVTLPPDHYFVIGDNRSNSTGSHIFGPLSKEAIVGRVWLCYWPPSEWGLNPDYSASAESPDES
jgi:signal peptidase I